jgi:hypothetical protein
MYDKSKREERFHDSELSGNHLLAIDANGLLRSYGVQHKIQKNTEEINDQYQRILRSQIKKKERLRRQKQ